MRKKLTIEEMREIAKSRDGECLSEKYVDNSSKLKWKCNKGHIWQATPNSIKRGTWCPKCSRHARLTIGKMQEIAKTHEGECLSNIYINSETKLKWKCKNGHEWEVSPAVIRRGCWCPQCGRKVSTIEKMQETAKERGGECLTNFYVNDKTKMMWTCNKKHSWSATPNRIISGTWCPTCNNGTIEEMQEIAKERGGMCLSSTYDGAHTKLEWKCNKNHIWMAKPNGIKNGTWCPVCRESFGERKIRYYLKLNNIDFVSQKTFEDCKGIRNELPFDFYLPQYNILIEFDGLHHYEMVNYGNSSNENAEKSYIKAQKNDEIKNRYCESKGIRLIRIPYYEKNIESILNAALNINL